MRTNRNRLIAVSVVFLALLVPVVFSSCIFPHGNDLDMNDVLRAPSSRHWFGTDNLGRDLLERSFNGLRLSLGLALSIQVICICLGAVVGSVAGYYGGVVDRVYVLVQNVVMSFPSLIASLCLIAMLGTGIRTLVLALVVVEWVTYARLIRSEVITLKESDYIQGCRAIGASNARILSRHILPNVVGPVIPIFTLMIGHTVLAISGLGFLGFGVQPPTAEIGLMINDGVTYLTRAFWMVFCPAAVLVLYAVVMNVFGDELREWFNPQRENVVL